MNTDKTSNASYTLLILDTHANFSFGEALGGKIDLGKLREHFKPAGDEAAYNPVYVMQRSERLTDTGYDSFMNTMQHRLGWEIDTCIDGFNPSRGHAIMVEAMQVSMLAIERLDEWCRRIGNNGEYVDLNLVLCVHHPTYAALLDKIIKLHPYVNVTLVCLDRTTSMLKEMVSNVVDIADLGVAMKEQANQ